MARSATANSIDTPLLATPPRRSQQPAAMTKKRGANKGRRDSKAAEEPKEGTSEEEREMEC